MKKLAVITATRAEYGLLSLVIKELKKIESDTFKVDVIATGTHLCQEFGYTISEIENDGVIVDYEIHIPVNTDTDLDISENQATTLLRFSRFFAEHRYNAIVILGDRYEMLAISVAARNTKTPIIHLCGGDVTEGAQDEWIRHSITKMASLHFVTNEDSYRRVLQMGENQEIVFNYGSTSIDNILNIATMSKEEAMNSVGLKDCLYAIGTYHPVTIDTGCIRQQMSDFFNAISQTSKIQFVVTKSNADKDGMLINQLLDEAEKQIHNLHVFTSLGVKRYLSLMKYAKFVIGNSSSGIIETPTFGIPTINIGSRQKGRLRVDSIIDCDEDSLSIRNAINLALSEEFVKKCRNVVSPYGDGTASKHIAKKIKELVDCDKVELVKKFNDLMG